MRRLLLLSTAAALRGPMSQHLRGRHVAAKTVAREDATTSRLLALEAERRELQARLVANEERQRALALGADVEPAGPKVLRKASSSNCETSPTVWDLECDVDYDAEDSRPAALAPDESTAEFLQGAASRGSWLVGLLAAQSLSSLVLENNEVVIQKHPVIVFFLTMLVGAGGNAGNQAAVRVIRGLAVGAIVPGENGASFVLREARMALLLACALSVVGYARVIAFSANTSSTEALAIATSLFLIVSLSIVLGAALPILLEKLGAGASNAATTIQVVMDVSGVLITCAVCGYLLDGTPPLSVLLPGVG
jgi:hypothetical protein